MDEKEKKQHNCDCGHEHEHDEPCDCGCEDADEDVIMLEDEEGNEYPYYHVATLEHEGKEYACLQEADEDAEEPQIEYFELEEVEEDGDFYYNLLPVSDELYDILDKKLAQLVEEYDDECDDPECDCHHNDENK